MFHHSSLISDLFKERSTRTKKQKEEDFQSKNMDQQRKNNHSGIGGVSPQLLLGI